jgi:di/tripeptidase
MSQDVRELEPKVLWNHFADLNAVPRPSKREERVIEFAKNFGESLGLETMVDEVGNVIIRKPASPGMEDRMPIVMQSGSRQRHNLGSRQRSRCCQHHDGSFIRRHRPPGG